MPRRMSCSMTIEAVQKRSKTVTRRHVDTWQQLAVGDRLTLIEKGMGLAKGERQVVLADVEVVDVRVEPLLDVDGDELIKEGFEFPREWWPAAWALWWARSHGYGNPDSAGLSQINVRRIEWRYLDEVGEQ